MSEAFEDRVLCDDGMCTGVVSRDGRCGTCGRLHHVDRAIEAPHDDEAAHDEAAHDETPRSEASPRDEDRHEEAPREDDDAREPCDDGLCTGVLNARRVCGTCGRPAGS